MSSHVARCLLDLLLFTLLFVKCAKARQCTAANRTSYLRSQSFSLDGDVGTAITGISLKACSERCTNSIQSGVDCDSFEFNDRLQTCSLATTSVQPFGPDSLVGAADVSNSFYQQICIPSSEVCNAPFSFERVPQRVLVGFALEVTPAKGASECLMNCLEASRRFRIECKSVMYYYETLECILNREDRRNRPDLFSTNTQGFIVDYYENNCAGTQCFSPETTQFLKTEQAVLTNERDDLIRNADVATCRDSCATNSGSSGQFPCKAFMVDESRSECYLANERSLPRGRADLEANNNVNYYEKICLSSRRNCLAGEQAFIRVPQKMLVGFANDVREVPSLAECLDECLNSAVDRCKSVVYFYDKAECILNSESRFTRPDMFADDTSGHQVDYFDNTCEDLDTSGTGGGITADPFPTPDSGGTEAVFPTSTTSTSRNPRPTKGTLETQCRFDGIFVRVTFSQATNGHLFVRNHFSSCKTDFVDAEDAVLVIPFPAGDNDNSLPMDDECGGVEMAPGIWSYMIVVQKNGFGVPGLMTSNDRIFNVTCDYSQGPVTVRTTTGEATDRGGSTGTNVIGGGTSNIAPSIRMIIVRDGRPVTSVLLGEELDLKWEIVQPVDGMGFLIRDCVAERLGGNPPHPSAVKLITEGCPDPGISDRLITARVTEIEDGFITKMQMFRFDGSKSVRLRCTVDMCVQRCRPAECQLRGETVRSMGRKKRQLDDFGTNINRIDRKEPPTLFNKPPSAFDSYEDIESDSNGAVVEKDTVSGVFTIVDQLNDVKLKSVERTDDTTDFRRQYSHDSRNAIRRDGKICLVRPLFVAIFGLLGMLCVAEGTVVILYYYMKHHQLTNNNSSTGDSSNSGGIVAALMRQMANRFQESTPVRGRSGSVLSSEWGRNGRMEPRKFPGSLGTSERSRPNAASMSTTDMEFQESAAYESTGGSHRSQQRLKGVREQHRHRRLPPPPSESDDTGSEIMAPAAARHRQQKVVTATVETPQNVSRKKRQKQPPLSSSEPPPSLPPKSAAVRAKQQRQQQWKENLPTQQQCRKWRTPPIPPSRNDSLSNADDGGSSTDDKGGSVADSEEPLCSSRGSSEHYMATTAIAGVDNEQTTAKVELNGRKKVHFSPQQMAATDSSSTASEAPSLQHDVGGTTKEYRNSVKMHSLVDEVKTRIHKRQT